jgi:hypothetical protein
MSSRNRRLMRYKPLGSRTGQAPSVHSLEGWRRPGPQLSSRAARPAEPQLKVALSPVANFAPAVCSF